MFRFEEQIKEILYIVKRIERRILGTPVSISLALPVITRNGEIVANQIQNDQVLNITILTKDGAGTVVPAPAGDSFEVVAVDADGTNPSVNLGAVIGVDKNGSPAVILTPLKQAATGVVVTTSDSAGLQSDPETFDIVQDLAPKAISLDIADATSTPQAVPAS